jgi:putative glutamine amidotransferase
MSEIKVGMSHSFSIGSLMNYYPNIEVIKDKTKVKNYDLIIFPGGEDINPMYYRENNIYSDYNDRRDNWEMDILNSAMDLGKKILGICRGLQLINVFFGGNLWQDIYFQLKEEHSPNHELQFEDRTVLSNYFSRVNSMHHQAIRQVGKGLNVTSMYKRVIESVENKNIIAVQFHPEFMPTETSKPFFEYLKSWAVGKENKKEIKEAKLVSEKMSDYEKFLVDHPFNPVGNIFSSSTADWTMQSYSVTAEAPIFPEPDEDNPDI